MSQTDIVWMLMTMLHFAIVKIREHILLLLCSFVCFSVTCCVAQGIFLALCSEITHSVGIQGP